jgi:membrane-associated phospholipid phosphatase
LNKGLNQYLKNVFRQERPNNPIKFLNSDEFSKKKYGMPSGHTQNSFLCIVFSYLVTNNIFYWKLMLLFIGIIVIIERYQYKNHTLQQLFSGAIVGSIVGYITYNLVTVIMQYVK